MKANNANIILFVILALAVGLGAGYFLFDSDETGTTRDEASPGMVMNSEQVWTCSMHPQIRQNEPGLCPICGMDLIPLDEVGTSSPLQLEMTNDAVKLAQIQTTLVGEGGGNRKELLLSGKIQEDERLAASQVAHVPGRIEKLFVTYTGEQVTEGQPIAVIYSPELITAQQELIQAAKLAREDSTLLRAARKKLEYWKIPQAEITEIETSGKIRERLTVNADVTGVVEKRRVAVGDYVARGEILFDFVRLDKLWVIFDAYEKDLPAIHVGDKVEFTTPAESSRIFTTRISFIDPLINPDTRVAAVRAEINNSERLLKPEMFVRGKLYSSGSTDKGLTVPKSAVLWTGERSVVYLKVPLVDVPTFRYQEVVLGPVVGDAYIVKSGLNPGDEVVTNGNFTIDAAAQLNNQASMMNRDVRVKGVAFQETVPDYQAETPGEFKSQLNALARSYLEIKDALVMTDGEGAAANAEQMLKNLDKVKMELLKGEAHIYWMAQSDAISAHTIEIEQSQDIDAQRKQFDFLSQAMIKVLRSFGVEEGTYYVQHCPMAFDNDGADWLSEITEIQNPYYGSKMLKCGTVQDTIRPGMHSIPQMKSKSMDNNIHNH